MRGVIRWSAYWQRDDEGFLFRAIIMALSRFTLSHRSGPVVNWGRDMAVEGRSSLLDERWKFVFDADHARSGCSTARGVEIGCGFIFHIRLNIFAPLFWPLTIVVTYSLLIP
jgi:hypothetical protein